MAQSACDGDIMFVWEQLVQAWCFWKDTALEEALDQLFTPWLQRVKPGSNQRYGIVAIFEDDVQCSALQWLHQCLCLQGSGTSVPNWAGILQDWPDHSAIETQKVVLPSTKRFSCLRKCNRAAALDVIASTCCNHFLFNFNRKYASVLYRFQIITSYCS